MRVLIADDEHLIADTLALIFEARGFEARAVYSGESVVDLAPTYRPDVLICDVVMGDVNGLQAADFVRRHVHDCGILLFSGHAASSPALHAIDADESSFEVLSKPVHPSVLLDYVEGFRRHTASHQP